MRSLPALTARDTSRVIDLSDTNTSGIRSSDLLVDISGISDPSDTRIRTFGRIRNGIRDFYLIKLCRCDLSECFITRSEPTPRPPSTAAMTTGRYSGRQPAITQLTAIFSIVAGAHLGGTWPMISRGSRWVTGEHALHALTRGAGQWASRRCASGRRTSRWRPPASLPPR